MDLNEELFRKISEDTPLFELLNVMGKTGEIDQIVFQKEGVMFRLAGGFFKEKIMADMVYIYDGKEEPLTKKWMENMEAEGMMVKEDWLMGAKEMWIDEHWLMHVPFPAEEKDFPLPPFPDY